MCLTSLLDFLDQSFGGGSRRASVPLLPQLKNDPASPSLASGSDSSVMQFRYQCPSQTQAACLASRTVVAAASAGTATVWAETRHLCCL